MPHESHPQRTEEPAAPSLIVGSQLRCPHCELVRDPLDSSQFRRFGRVEKYARDLNVVYQCVKRTGGCGHVFSPGDQRILIAFLNGDLVPAAHANGINGDTKEVSQ